MFTALNNKLKVVGVSKDKIFPLGYRQNIAVVNDSLYSDLAKDSLSINTSVYGYDYKNWENSGDIISKLQEKIQKNSLNDYDKGKYYEIFNSLPYMYKVEVIEIGSMFFIPYFITFLNSIFSVISISSMKGTYLGLKGIIVSFVFFVICFMYFLFLKTKYIKEKATNLN
ncbi:hypothetical protein [Paraclostridium sordellii]|uniref:hypothetical protein n=1 Tax=Paraclostridium sordellii TaxID=1505 RepID=UPI0005E0DCD3|nr:hypothetical protein [Paeniclostridium sordellii]CEN81490.1 ABC transporter permease [[Clostridium] sordellii] [Paeniclostridium sordellii]CEQ20010.1 ABC transporter permease [[Clostridium] sordellii] [Paeniclostridium sordellii]